MAGFTTSPYIALVVYACGASMEEAEDDDDSPSEEVTTLSTEATETPRRTTKKAKRKTETFLRDMCDFYANWYSLCQRVLTMIS